MKLVGSPARGNCGRALFSVSFLVLSALAGCSGSDNAGQGSGLIPPGSGGQYSPQPQDPKRRRALIIGLDGTTGNQFHQATFERNIARNFLELMFSGKYTTCTQNTDPRCAHAHSGRRFQEGYLWKTGPGWGSVLTGADTGHHLLKDNGHDHLKVFATSSTRYPSFLKRAKDLGMKTAAAGVASFLFSHHGKSTVPGVLDYECGAGDHGPLVSVDDPSSCNLSARYSLDGTDQDRDAKLAAWLEDRISDPSFDIIMGVFDQIDSAGHSHGFDGNSGYMKAIATADLQVSNLINAIKQGAISRNEEWLVIVTSDHGGHRILFWGDHATVFNEDEVIPFVVTTFGSDRPLKDLVYPVTHMDVHPTVMKWFGIDSPQADGHAQAVE